MSTHTMTRHRRSLPLVALVVCLPLFASVQPAWAEIYGFVDGDGIIHLSNVPSDPRYRPVRPGTRRRASRLGPAEVDRLVSVHSRRNGLPPALLRAVIKTESDFDPYAVSRAGALGLMQLMPETASMLKVTNPFDPEQNVRGGAAYLRSLLIRFRGDLTLALAAYNAGAEAVERYKALPPYRETRRFVRKVLRHYRRYALDRRQPLHPTLTPSWNAARSRPPVVPAGPAR